LVGLASLENRLLWTSQDLSPGSAQGTLTSHMMRNFALFLLSTLASCRTTEFTSCFVKVTEQYMKSCFPVSPWICTTANHDSYPKLLPWIHQNRNKAIRSSQLNDLDPYRDNSDLEDQILHKRKQYLQERLTRERLLLRREPSPVNNQSTADVPEYISRWGGADLAQEGPTRKILELMNDSEW
jgi:hypothetical protein